jgi:hypothetical protein
MTTYPVTASGAVTATDATAAAGAVSGGVETPGSATDSRTAGPGVKAPAVDTVTLQGKARGAIKERPKQGNDLIGGRIGSVVFVYNWKGDLRIRFMDSKNTLVYQTPPVMMARTADLMMRPNSSVSAMV